ncbi:MAG: transcriptional regulator [Gemmatimonadota bacterium]|jgi:DNA-binding MarR family transcriptional regulator
MSDEARDGLDGLSGLDRTLHEPARLQIMAHLYILEAADFLFLLRRTGLTKGNLSSHVRKLEESGYVEVEKKFVDRHPVTTYALTEAGRAAFGAYRDTILEALGALVDPAGSH